MAQEKFKKYKVKLNIVGFPQKILEVKGEPIAIQGKEYIGLFIYQLEQVSFGDKTIIFQDKWHVAEETSGMPIGKGCNKQAAISHASAVLSKYSKEKTLWQIEKYKIN
ncbi:MAG: hypothetical protein ACYCSQ_00655 [bacterium]